MISSGRRGWAASRDVQDHPDRQRVEVGVDEPAAGDVIGAAEDLDVDALAAAHAEALVDDLLRQGQGLLDPDREVGRVDRW